MNPKLIFILPLIIFASCSKSDIKKNGCGDGDIGFVGLNLDSCSMFINNLFTPNGDIYNQTFPEHCDCPEATAYSLVVKKGSKTLFETTNPVNDCWDGTLDGKDVKEGVYDWEMSYTVQGIQSDFSGTITLVRDISEPVAIEGTCLYILTDPIVIE